jgi:hypothetical protein
MMDNESSSSKRRARQDLWVDSLGMVVDVHLHCLDNGGWLC